MLTGQLLACFVIVVVGMPFHTHLVGVAALLQASIVEFTAPMKHLVQVGRRGGIGIEWRDRIGIDVEGYARQNRPNPLDTQTAGYTLVHVTGGSEVRLLGRVMRLDIALRNALNTRYRSFLSRYKTFALDPGRNLIVRLSTGDVD